MEDVNISKYRASVVRDGSKPASPGFVVSEGQDPVNPPGTNNYVPYSGATANVELGEYGVESGFITLDTTPTNTPVDQGTIYWDDSRSTAALIMNGTLQHIGQDTFFYVKNSSGSNIPKGTCVRFAGTDGASGHLLVAPFLADGTYPSTYFMGVTAEAIANGSFGQVMHFGELEGINTSGFTAGALLYASSTVAGGFQTTAPVAPNNIILVAAAVNSKNNGAIVVRPTLGSNINTDEGVKITSPTTGDLLQLQAGGLWENKTKAQILGGTSSQFVKGDGSLDSTSYQPLLTNPVTGTGTTNYLPKFTGTSSIGNSIVQDAGIRVDIGGDIRLTPSSAVNIQAYTGSVYTNLFYNAASHNWQTSGGATKMFLNSNDNLLIGTTSDNGARLQVSGNVYIARSSNPYLTIDDTGVNSEGGILFKPSGFNSKGGLTINYSTAEQRLFVGEGGNSYFQTFYTNGSERMRITSSGNLLVGTTTDNGARLQVSGEGRFYQPLTNTTSYLTVENNRARNAAIRLKTTVGDFYLGTGIGADVNQFQIFDGTAGANRLTISSTGAATFSSSVAAGDLISTSYGTARIQITSTANNTNAGLRFTAKDSGGTSKNSGLYYVAGTNTSNTFLSLSADDNNYQFNVLASGNVGIGTSSPVYTLDVRGRIYAGTALLIGESGSGYSLIESTGGNGIWLRPNGVSSPSGMFLTTAGNVLIGTTTDNGARLQVSGTSRFSDRVFVDGNLSGNNIAFLKNASSNGYGLLIQGGTSTNYALFITDYIGTQIFQMLGNGAATFSSSVTTGAPAGGTAQPWKLGTVATVSPTSPNRTIEVEVNGTTYYLHAKTTNN